MKKMKKLIKKIYALAIIMLMGFITTSCLNSDFDQVAYYKGPDKNRVYVYTTETTDMSKIKKHANKLMNTEGQMTVAVYYKTAPRGIEQVTSCGTFDYALQLACQPNCIAAYWKYPSGLSKFSEYPNFNDD